MYISTNKLRGFGRFGALGSFAGPVELAAAAWDCTQESLGLAQSKFVPGKVPSIDRLVSAAQLTGHPGWRPGACTCKDPTLPPAMSAACKAVGYADLWTTVTGSGGTSNPGSGGSRSNSNTNNDNSTPSANDDYSTPLMFGAAAIAAYLLLSK